MNVSKLVMNTILVGYKRLCVSLQITTMIFDAGRVVMQKYSRVLKTFILNSRFSIIYLRAESVQNRRAIPTKIMMMMRTTMMMMMLMMAMMMMMMVVFLGKRITARPSMVTRLLNRRESLAR